MTDRTDLPQISTEHVQGTDVFGPDGKEVGEIDHLMIDKRSGRVTYAVMSFGGFLGLGEGHHPVPWSALKYNTEMGGYQTGITEEQLRNAPEFGEQSWSDREWEKRVHQHYGAGPYWA